MSSVNKVILVGNLGRDPEIRSFQNGGRCANLSLATSESWKDKQSGERKERTEWHRIVVFNEALVGVCEKYLNKGSKVYIEGQIETRKFTDNSGNERYTTEIVLRPFRSEIVMLDSKQDSGDQGASGDSGGSSDYGQRPDTNSTGGGDLDDEIPFGPCIY